jgi:hypothetical protein
MASHNQAGGDTVAIESDDRKTITDVALATDCLVADPAALSRSLFAVDVLLRSGLGRRSGQNVPQNPKAHGDPTMSRLAETNSRVKSKRKDR